VVGQARPRCGETAAAKNRRIYSVFDTAILNEAEKIAFIIFPGTSVFLVGVAQSLNGENSGTST